MNSIAIAARSSPMMRVDMAMDFAVRCLDNQGMATRVNHKQKHTLTIAAQIKKKWDHSWD